MSPSHGKSFGRGANPIGSRPSKFLENQEISKQSQMSTFSNEIIKLKCGKTTPESA
jgi:hypothetical protein